MTSYRQIEANRRNALRSTGPKTEAGKQASRCNAIRHGFTAETIIVALEDAEDYKAFEAAISADYDAQSAVERELVLRLASLLWRLRRATMMETGLFELEAEHLHGDHNLELVQSSSHLFHELFRGSSREQYGPARNGGYQRRIGRNILENYGMAHKTDTVCRRSNSSSPQRHEPVGLWLSAAGQNANAAAKRLSIAQVALGSLAALLKTINVRLITLHPQFSGIVLPSKIYAYLESRRPFLCVGPESSDVHLLCTHSAGLLYRRIEPGDSARFAAALEYFADQDISSLGRLDNVRA